MLYQFQKKLLKKAPAGSWLVLLFCLLTALVFAAPHDGDIFELEQPDKTRVTVKVYGDEFYQDIESPEGYTLIRDPRTGWICYATLAADGSSYVSTGTVYKPENAAAATRGGNRPAGITPHLRIKGEARKQMAQKKKQILDPSYAYEEDTYQGLAEGMEPAPEAAPFGGDIVGMTLLIEFPDVKSSIPRNDIINMLNQQGYTGYSNNGSVRDYFYDVSNGALTYTNQVTQFVTVSQPKSYYDDDSDYGHVRELIVEALNLVQAQGGYNFSALSTTGDRFYAVNVLYAGSPSAGWAKGLWPHAGNLRGAWSINGIYIRNYQLTNIGTNLSIGTFVHENGHMLLNFRDLYAYDSHDKGVGRFCVMCSTNGKNPQMFNPYFRYLRGWLTYADIGTTANATYSHVANRVDSAYYYGVNGGSTEYFLIEARRRTGRSAGLPADGLLVWHIKTDGNNMYQEYQNMVSVEQADGRNDLENNVNTGDTNDAFYAGYRTEFNDTTTPNARYYTGANSGLIVRNVSAVGDTMTFDIGNGGTVITPTPTPTPTATPTATPTPTPTSVPTPTPNQNPIWSGGPYTLNGTSDFIDVPDGLTNNLYDFSVACWVKLNSVTTWARVFDFAVDTTSNMFLTIASDTGYPRFAITNNGASGEQRIDGTSALPAGSWQHLVVVKSGNTGILYINKQEAGRNSSMTLRPLDLGSTVNNYIGRSQYASDPYLGGSVSNFTVYNRALSSTEVAALGNTPPDQSGVKGDVNGDGNVTIVDAMIIAQYVSGLNPANYNGTNADVNCDGSVNINDALLVARYAAGLITALNC